MDRRSSAPAQIRTIPFRRGSWDLLNPLMQDDAAHVALARRSYAPLCRDGAAATAGHHARIELA